MKEEKDDNLNDTNKKNSPNHDSNNNNNNNMNTSKINQSPHSNNKSHSRSNSESSSYRSPFSSRSNSKSKKSRSYSSSHSPSYSSSSSSSYRHERRRREGIPQIFVTKLGPRVTEKDLEREFRRFGHIRNLKLKKGYAFIEYYKHKNAKYAIRELNDKKLFNLPQRVVVEEAKDYRREKERRRRDMRRDYRSRSRDYYYHKKMSSKSRDKCFKCGEIGHWAYECKEKRKNR